MQKKHFVETIDKALLKGIAVNRTGLSLLQDDRKRLLKLSRNILELHVNTNNPSQISTKEINLLTESTELSIAKSDAIIFVTFYKEDIMLSCACRKSNTLAKSVACSTIYAISLVNDKKDLDPKKIYIEINVLFNQRSFKNLHIMKENLSFGLNAIGLKYKKKFVILKNSVPIKYGYTIDQTLIKLAKKCGYKKSILKSKNLTLFLYNSIEFREDYYTKNNKYGLYDLYRGNHIMLQKEITKKSLNTSLDLTYSLLKKFICQKKIPYYGYCSFAKSWFDSNKNEAILRKLASVWILLETSKYKNDLDGLTLGENSINCFINKYFITNSNMGFLLLNNSADIGSSGFLLLSLLSLANPKSYLKKIKELAQFIYSSYDESNRRLLPISKAEINLPHESELFFPGIAMIALLKSFFLCKDYKYIELIENVFPYYNDIFYNRPDGIKMLTWMSSVCSEFYLLTKNNKYKNFLFEINDTILNKQFTEETSEIDLIGSFSCLGSPLVTASITESLIDAYQIAKFTNNLTKAKFYKTRILMALRFILQSQIRPCNTSNTNMIGGYKNNFFDSKIRIDTLQHTLCALLKFLRL